MEMGGYLFILIIHCPKFHHHYPRDAVQPEVASVATICYICRKNYNWSHKLIRSYFVSVIETKIKILYMVEHHNILIFSYKICHTSQTIFSVKFHIYLICVSTSRPSCSIIYTISSLSSVNGDNKQHRRRLRLENGSDISGVRDLGATWESVPPSLAQLLTT